MFRSWPVTVCLAVAYFGTGYAGLMLPAVGSTITLLWLPTGIAVAALRRWGVGCWPGVLIGALAVNLAVGSPFALSIGIAVGNTLGPLLTTWVLVRSGFCTDLKRPRDILLLGGAAGVGMAVTASVGVVCLVRAGLLPSGYATAWLIWWAGDVTGVITAAPLVLVSTHSSLRGLWVRRTELAYWVVLLVVAIAVVFLLNGTSGPALSVAFLPFPLLVWAAIRFGPIGTSLGVIVLSFGAALGTSAGYGPFARPLPTDSVLSLGLFMLTCIAVGWLVAALTVSQAEATGARRVLEQALDEVAFGVLVAGVDRRITHVNAGFTRLTGYAEGELVGGSCDLLQGPETDPATVARLKAALRDGRGFEGDILNYRKDGTAFWNALLITPIHNEVGEWVGFLGIQRDVTALKREQLAHSLSEERYRAIVDLVPECVKIVSPDGRLVAMNAAGLDMIGADSLDQVRGAPLESLIAPNDRPAFLGLTRRVTQLGESGTCEFAITSLKGTRRQLETHAVPYRDERHEVVGVLAVTRDITRQKQVTAELEQTVATLKLFVDTVPAMIAFIDAEERYQLVNARFADFFSLTADQILGRTVREFHTPEAYQVIEPHIRAVLRGEAVHYQSSLPRPDGSRFWFEARYIPRAAADGTVSGYYVMVFDISDRMRAEQELRASRDRLDFLVASSPAVIYTSNPFGDFAATFLSANVRGVTGYEPEEFTRDPQFWIDRVHPQDLPGILEGLQTLTANGRHSYEYRFRTRSGAYRWMRDDMVLNRDSDGNPVEVIGSWLDVTDRRRAEEELRISESRLDSFFTASPVGMAIYDTDCRWTHVNPTLAAMNGLPVEAHVGHRPSDLLSADLAAGIEAGLRRILATGVPDINREVSGTTPARSGMTRHGLSTQAPIFDADGRIAGVGVVVVETTELKRAEAALRASEERYRLLFEANPHPMWVYDRETLRFLAVNEAAVRHYGYSRDEFLAMTIKDIRPADEVPRLLENVRNVGTGIDLAGVWRHHKKDGAVIEVEISSHVLTFDGRATEVVLAHDVTAQKRAERALVENEARLRLALAAANQGLFDVDLLTGECVVSPEYATMLGFDPAEFRETKAAWLERLHPDDRERVSRADEDYLAGRRGEFRVEFRLRTRSGDWKWVFSIGAVVAWTPDGRPLRMLGTHTDITDRKRAEDEVRRARDTAESALTELRGASARAEQFYQLCQAAGQGIGIARLDGTLTYLNPAFRRMLHIPDDDDIRRTAFWELVPSENHPFLAETVLARTRETGSWTGEFDLLTRTGQRVPIINTVVLLRDPEGAVVGYTNIATDITEQKRAETALRESEERLRIFVENAPAGVAMLDRELRYLSHSRRWLVDYGLGEQNLLGRSHYDVFPDIPDRWKEIHRRCLTGVSERCEQDQFARVDGGTDYLRWEIQPWTDATGAVGGLVFFTESITDRVNTELRLRAALQEKEALLKEVHHRVKNNLQIITSLLNLQAETVRDPAVLGLLRESQTRVRAMALVHETLYRSGDFGRIDLAGYLTSICNYLARSYGIDTTHIQMAVEVADTTLDLDRAVPCGLIINELVSNALKHAFPGGRAGRVAVRLWTEADRYYHLSVSDDGVGLPAALDWRRLPSLGLQLVSDLVLQLGGHLTVLQGPGAEYRIRIPLSPPPSGQRT